jgi:hypothetical protein
MQGTLSEEQVLRFSQASDPDILALEVGHTTDAWPRPQFEAANMHAGNERDSGAAVDRGDPIRSEVYTEIDLGARKRLGSASWVLRHIADLGKALGPQQLLGDMLRGNADARVFEKPYGGGFEGSFRGQRSGCACEACGAG